MSKKCLGHFDTSRWGHYIASKCWDSIDTASYPKKNGFFDYTLMQKPQNSHWWWLSVYATAVGHLKDVCCSGISKESDAKPILCRVFWRQIGSRTAIKNDTKSTSLRITGLKDGSTYECVIKAGNHLGTSTLTEAVRFTTGDKYITSAASLGKTKNTEIFLVCCFFLSKSIMLCS